MNLPIQSQPVNRQKTFIATPAEGVNPSICVGGSVSGRQICVNVPVLGRKCITSPIPIPAGASVRACTCNHFGVPTGVCIDANVAGHSILHRCIGWC